MILVSYKCTCMQDEGSFLVRDRTAVENAVEWVEGPMAKALGADHRRRSPTCTASKVEYVKIPMPENAPYLGGAPVLNA